MNLKIDILCIVALLALGASALPASGIPFLSDSNINATIHGATYAYDTFEPLNDTVININSNPPQSIVAKDSTYSFELGPGDYIITANYFRNNTLLYSKEATLKIEAEGNYVYDLLLYPVPKNPATEKLEEVNNTSSISSAGKTSTELSGDTGSFITSYLSAFGYLPVVLMLFLLIGGGYGLSRKYKNVGKSALGKSSISREKQDFGNVQAVSMTEPISEPVENSEIETAALKKIPLSTDLGEVLDIIQSHRGRITQKDLRSKLDYSEVKVSLLLSELEKRGLIKKLKRGRENIVILADEQR
jgi:uncharacterized membrane protein